MDPSKIPPRILRAVISTLTVLLVSLNPVQLALALSNNVDITLTWDDASCTVLMNGRASYSDEATRGQTVNLTTHNETGYSLTMSYDPVGGSLDSQHVLAGETVTKSFTDFQGTQATPEFDSYGGPQTCSGGSGGPVFAYIYAVTPATPRPPSGSSSPPSAGSGNSSASKPSSSSAALAQTINPPILTSVSASGQTLSINKPISLKQGEVLKLSGTTIANGVVSLTLHSTPKTVSTTANAAGYWEYTFNDIPPGTHYIDSTVTNSANGRTSPTSKLITFDVKQVKVVGDATKPKKGYSVPILVLLALLITLAAAGMLRLRKDPLILKNTIKRALARENEKQVVSIKKRVHKAQDDNLDKIVKSNSA